MIRQYFIAVLLIFLQHIANGQTWKDDLALIKDSHSEHSTAYYQRPGNNARVIETHQTNIIAKYNPVTLVLKGTMLAYQHVISPQLSRHCPYEITCSNFSKQAIEEFGIVKGVFLSADRILRCNRIGVLDTDPLDFNEQNGTIKDSPHKYQ